ncbi:urease accessory protein UreF [Hymenobacter sp. NBH84]|uniref:urease accessory protein UreF n=1 Tax=Hymenobacter sp. NBH84 TaxID=2596915 RepID=UPI0016299754|nr:urease accessory UreF family protein [Hymenobacter sp. NBH84]
MHLARLLHLTDSALPTGSFAYSYGLESSATFGLLPDSGALRNYLYSFLQQVVSLEFPFLNSCFHLPENTQALHDLAAEYDAQLLVPPLHRASLVQASNWLRLLVSFYPTAGLAELSSWFAGLPLHFVPAFALSLRRVGFGLDEARTAYLHMALRDQISAAIRLGVLGPMEGHRLQHDFYAIFEELLAAPTSVSYQEATRSGFLLEVTQLFHEDIYSKLFQN